MPGHFRRRGLGLFPGLVLFLGLGSVVNLARAIGPPYGGFFAWRNVHRGTWQLEAAAVLA